MKNHFKFLCLALAALALFSLGKCGGVFAGEKSDVTLMLWYWDEGQSKSIKIITDNFTKKTGIGIRLTQIPWDDYWVKLQTALPTGTGPDIMWMHTLAMDSYTEAGHIMPLNDLIERDNVDLSRLSKPLFSPFVKNGELYGIPKDFDTIGLWYNKAMFDAAKIDYPNDAWTWDDYRKAAQALTIRANNRVVQYGTIVQADLQAGTYNFMYQNGAKIFGDDGKKCTIASPEGKETLQFMLDLIHKDKVSPTMEERAGMEETQFFSAGQCAMIVNGCWRGKEFHDSLGEDLGVAPLPMKRKKAVIVNGLAYSGYTKSKYPAEVWEFLKYSSTYEAQEPQGMSVIPAYMGAEKMWLDSLPNVDLKIFIDALDYSVPYPIAASNALSAENTLMSGIEKILMQPQVGENLDKLQKSVQTEIEK